jgi:hypothetical protein
VRSGIGAAALVLRSGMLMDGYRLHMSPAPPKLQPVAFRWWFPARRLGTVAPSKLALLRTGKMNINLDFAHWLLAFVAVSTVVIVKPEPGRRRG